MTPDNSFQQFCCEVCTGIRWRLEGMGTVKGMGGDTEARVHVSGDVSVERERGRLRAERRRKRA